MGKLVIVFLGSFAACIASSPAPVKAFSQTDAMYADCSAFWATNKWSGKPNPKALVSGAQGAQTTCFGSWNAQSIEAATRSARAACAAKFSEENCFTFAQNNTLMNWAQRKADRLTGKRRSVDQYRFLACTELGWWERYKRISGPKAMASGLDEDGDPTCLYRSKTGNYQREAGRAMDDCRAKYKDCEVFAIGKFIQLKWMSIGDSILGKHRSPSEYHYLACASPEIRERYSKAPHGKALVSGLGKTGGARCYLSSGQPSVVAATDDAEKKCGSEARECLIIAYDDTLAPWVKAMVDQMRGVKKPVEARMAYYCGMYVLFDGYFGRRMSKALVAMERGGSVTCTPYYGGASHAAARDEALSRCNARSVLARCEAFAVGDKIQPKFAKYAGKWTAAVPSLCVSETRIDKARFGRCDDDQVLASVNEANTLRRALWKGRFCENQTSGSSYRISDVSEGCKPGFQLAKGAK